MLNSYFTNNKKLKKSYKHIALVSHSRHISKVKTDLSSTLFVCSDWILTFDLSKKGYDAIHYESGIQNWNGDGLESDLYNRANDWIFINGEDKSKYRGVSLGKLFSRDISFVYIAYSRLHYSLSFICKKYKPKEVQFLDYRAEIGILDCESKLSIVHDVCSRYDIDVKDISDCPDDDTDEFPQYQIYGSRTVKRESLRIFRKIYYAFWIFISYLFNLIKFDRRKVVFFTGGHIAQVVSKQQKYSNKILPIFFISTLKKSPIKLLKVLIGGGHLEKPIIGSDEIDSQILNKIYKTYLNYWDGLEKSTLEKILFSHIKNKIFNSERIVYYCSQIEKSHKYLEKLKPKRILIDSVFGADSRIVMEISAKLGIKVDYIWHGFWQHIIYFDAISGDLETKPMIDNIYSWGEQNERWLKAIGWKGSIVRVGNPFADKYSRAQIKDNQKKAGQNILLLQYTPMNSDIKGLNSNQYGYLVDLVSYLNQIDGVKVRVKLHPGVFKKSYYARIIKMFDLKCELRDDSPFEKHIDWADKVIGPCQSGAYLEVLAAGKPYYPVMMPPHSNIVGIKNGKVYYSLKELKNDFSKEIFQNNDDLLEELISLKEFSNPSLNIINELAKE